MSDESTVKRVARTIYESMYDSSWRDASDRDLTLFTKVARDAIASMREEAPDKTEFVDPDGSASKLIAHARENTYWRDLINADPAHPSGEKE